MVKALNCRNESEYYMSDIYNIVNRLELSNGETKRMNCPECGGIKTFTATNNMGSLVWNCYKASCTVGGGTRVHLSVDDIRSGFLGVSNSLQSHLNYLVTSYRTGISVAYLASASVTS
jgi:ribosomal protein L37AE/L43A